MNSNGPMMTEVLKAFEPHCESELRGVRQAGSVRDAVQASQVKKPNELRGVARTLPATEDF